MDLQIQVNEKRKEEERVAREEASREKSNGGLSDELQKLIGLMGTAWGVMQKPSQTPAQLVRPLKVPLWTKNMSMETYEIQIRNWAKNQEGVPEI